MSIIKPWAKIPTEWIIDGTIKEFDWNRDRATETAALMIFFTLCHYAREHSISPLNTDVVMAANLTYSEIGDLASLSRKLISSGLKRLEMLNMISRLESNHAGKYMISGLESGKRWAKLPGYALLSSAKTKFEPFSHFSLRSRHELNAIKMYLYYASVRDRVFPYSEVSYEKICEKTGVAERYIPRANSLLTTCELLARVGRDWKDDVKQHEPNKYYLTGYKTF